MAAAGGAAKPGFWSTRLEDTMGLLVPFFSPGVHLNQALLPPPQPLAPLHVLSGTWWICTSTFWDHHLGGIKPASQMGGINTQS